MTFRARLANFIGQCHLQTTPLSAFSPVWRVNPRAIFRGEPGCHGTLERLLIPEIYRINLPISYMSGA